MPDYDERTPLACSEEHSCRNYTDVKETQFYNSCNGVEISMSSSPKIHFSWHDISVQLPSQTGRLWKRFSLARKAAAEGKNVRRNILTNVSGFVRPGELLAILGASGAGKTTLLNVLTLRHRGNLKVDGAVYVNGKRVNSKLLTSISAYVQQDDLFIGTLTVKEHLTFQALLRMDRKLSYSQRIRRVNDVINELGLTKCKDQQIGIPGRVKGISGGEKRRLAFATEVLTDPPLLFCDEPTSGLDSYMAQSMVAIMRAMAAKGKTVVCTIHQPSSEIYAMFDRIFLLSEGRVAYTGYRPGALMFFESLGMTCPANYNPADFFIHTLAVVPGRELQQKYIISLICDAFADSEMGEEVEKEAAGGMQLDLKEIEWEDSEAWDRRYKANIFHQIRAVMWRSTLAILREPVIIKLKILQTIFIGVLLAIVYWRQEMAQSRVMNFNGVLFLLLINVTFQNMFAVMTIFSSEIPIFIREHSNGMYTTFAYFICKTSAELPAFVLMPLILTSIVYWSVGLYPHWSNFFIACVIVIFVANTAISFGYMISSLTSNANMALSIGPPFLLPFMLFGGFFLNADSIPWFFKWLQYVSWFRYGFEALCINQWKDIDYIRCDLSNNTCPANGRVILQSYGFKIDRFHIDVVMILVLLLVMRVVTFLALLCRSRNRR